MNIGKISLVASILFFATQVASIENHSADEIIQGSDARVTIEWVEPKKFRDVYHPTTSTKRYREAVFADLEAYFNSLAEQLPEGQKLKLRVTDLDLAGTVQPGSMAGLGNSAYNSQLGSNEYRVVRPIDIPRMEFSFELLDNTGKVLKQGEVNLKDMSFMSRTSTLRKNTSLLYEKTMIARWFEETLMRER